MSKTLLTALFNHDFSGLAESELRARFFGKVLTPADLRQVGDVVRDSAVVMDGRSIPAALEIAGDSDGPPFLIMAQLHGNEPAGLAGILLAMALSQAGLLRRRIIGLIGNPLAAEQYFAALAHDPQARQETRDAYRCGLDAQGNLLADMNRVPVDFLSREPTDAHSKRAHEIYWVGQRVCGMADIHSARGNMVCFTDHKHDRELKDSPIRNVLLGLNEAISAYASAAVTVKTWKPILGALPNIEHQVGIEAGRHEAPETPQVAASFTLSLLHALGMTEARPLYDSETGQFNRYQAHPRITYADLAHEETLRPDDRIYMARSCQSLASVPERSDQVIVRRADGTYALQSIAAFAQAPEGSMEFAVYQYDEMEAIAANQAVAVAVPSGTEFRTKQGFSTLFISKSAALYDKDPAVGPWPVAAGQVGQVKFCYPCDVSPMTISFIL